MSRQFSDNFFLYFCYFFEIEFMCIKIKALFSLRGRLYNPVLDPPGGPRAGLMQLNCGSTDCTCFFDRVASLRTLYKPMSMHKSTNSRNCEFCVL